MPKTNHPPKIKAAVYLTAYEKVGLDQTAASNLMSTSEWIRVVLLRYGIKSMPQPTAAPMATPSTDGFLFDVDEELTDGTDLGGSNNLHDDAGNKGQVGQGGNEPWDEFE